MEIVKKKDGNSLYKKTMKVLQRRICPSPEPRESKWDKKEPLTRGQWREAALGQLLFPVEIL